MKEELIKKAYEIAQERYAEIGINTEKVLEQLQDFHLSMHCWQADDVHGFEVKEETALGSGLAVTGNFPGAARRFPVMISSALLPEATAYPSPGGLSQRLSGKTPPAGPGRPLAESLLGQGRQRKLPHQPGSDLQGPPQYAAGYFHSSVLHQNFCAGNQHPDRRRRVCHLPDRRPHP